MFVFQFIFGSFVLATPMTLKQDQVCACRKYATETSCKELVNCKWSQKMCQTKQCSDFLNEKNCDNRSECGWNISKCEVFTKCSDFYSSDPYNCYNKGDQSKNQWCQPSEINYGYCEDYSFTNCEKGYDENTCQGFGAMTTLCFWNGNKCESIEIRKCSTLTTSNLCSIFGSSLGCKWKNNKCMNYNCQDFTTQGNCIIARPDDIREDITVCKWNQSTVASESTCIEAENLDHLTSENCYNYTLHTHLWDKTTATCLSCQLYEDAPVGTRLLLENLSALFLTISFLSIINS